MKVLLVTRTAVYLRLPEVFREKSICDCNAHLPGEGEWDCLVVPVEQGHYTYRVHLPPSRVEKTKEYFRKTGELVW